MPCHSRLVCGISTVIVIICSNHMLPFNIQSHCCCAIVGNAIAAKLKYIYKLYKWLFVFDKDGMSIAQVVLGCA